MTGGAVTRTGWTGGSEMISWKAAQGILAIGWHGNDLLSVEMVRMSGGGVGNDRLEGGTGDTP